MAINCAIIGLGNIGFRFELDPKRKNTWTHMGAYTKCKDTHVVGAVEMNPEHIKAFGKAYPDIPVYANVKELFAHHTVDLVSICVPTKEHFSVFSEVMNFNPKAVFCEKPLSGTIGESKKMVSVSQRKNIIVAVNYTRRWQSAYMMVRDIIRQGKVGDLAVVNAVYTGHIYTVGSHLFDTVLMLTRATPLGVSAVTIQQGVDPRISGWFMLKKKSDEDIFFSFSSAGKREDLIFEIDVIGTEGRIRITDNGSRLELFIFEESNQYSGYRELVPKEIRPPADNDRFADAVCDIVQVMEGKQKKVQCSEEEALLVDKMIGMAISSARKAGMPEKIK